MAVVQHRLKISGSKKLRSTARHGVELRSMKTGITFRTFDVFHYGHLRLLERAPKLCDRLVVGV